MAAKKHKNRKKESREKSELKSNSLLSSVFFCAFCAFLRPFLFCFLLPAHRGGADGARRERARPSDERHYHNHR